MTCVSRKTEKVFSCKTYYNNIYFQKSTNFCSADLSRNRLRAFFFVCLHFDSNTYNIPTYTPTITLIYVQHDSYIKEKVQLRKKGP